MKIEEEIFKKARINEEKLIPYGFHKVNDTYKLIKPFNNLSFQAEITITNKSEVQGKIIDIETREEYENFRIESQNGVFVNKVREEYKTILESIKKNCFKEESFILEESNCMARYIKEKYGIEPEFLWKKYPGFGVFRNKKNNKWFALIANVDKSKLMDSKGETEIINVKIDERKLDDYLKQKGIYKAYHMNNKKWISIILDGTLEEKVIEDFIEKSYNIVNQKK